MNGNRSGFARLATLCAGGATAVAIASFATSARAQQAGLTNRPSPNVLLLVDTSGSMERMVDGSLPQDNRNPAGGTLSAAPLNACSPGVESNPNRWGILLQALTGSFQPFYSCDAMPRTSGLRFAKEYSINNREPYDKDYSLPYHRPLTGSSALTSGACANVPFKMAGNVGVGVGNYSNPSANPGDFLPDAILSFKHSYLSSGGSTPPSLVTSGNTCTFEQADDGQLDAVADFVRFGLMTFDTDPSADIGINSGPFPAGTSVLTTTGAPFLGQWSYPRTNNSQSALPTPVTGQPAGCATSSPFDVGARHWAAPPWEGRMIPFAAPLGTLLDNRTTNEQIQKVLLATRPYGATPIDGMLDDARDYLWYNDYGPWGTQAGYADPFVKADSRCRSQYIVLLTDGAPNLDLKPACARAGTPAGVCPYQEAWEIADRLFRNKKPDGTTDATRSQVPTFVIGFSVSGSNRTANDGFPAAYTTAAQRSCKAWFADPVNGGNANATTMDTVCNSVKPAAGSTAEACCELNKIALYGSGGPSTSEQRLGAFFADNAADLVNAFSRILAQVSKAAATRTTPASSPTVVVGSRQESAGYVASFIPNARKVWSGEIDRTRSYCNSGAVATVTQSVSGGDSYAVNTAVQAGAQKRWFFTAVGTSTGTVDSIAQVDSRRTMRPYSSGTPSDGIPVYRGQEVAGIDNTLISTTTNFPGALGINNNTCKRTTYVYPGGTTGRMPALGASDCTEVIWDFATSYASAVTKSGFDFNLRCKNADTASATEGVCSIGGGTCTISTQSTACTVPGETCVPKCSALGAIFRSAPLVVGPPSGFLRDEGWRTFQSLRANRRPILYVATTDGVLHAFKALPDSDTAEAAGPGSNYELWGFVPPAVLPRLATNYPGGQQILLDGSPVVREVVWDRSGDSAGNSSVNKNDWHTTLVASLGSGGGGYYALNVSDGDCGGRTNADSCRTNNAWEAPSPGSATANLQSVSVGADTANSSKKGPHFLWQITDVEKDASGVDQAPETRTSVADTKSFVALFGRQTFTPAITTVLVKDASGVLRQVGVAVLPGGLDGPPIAGGSCARAIGSSSTYTADAYDASDSTNLARRASVRQWASSCAGAVPGRGLTLVRLDTGEILRHFGRVNQDVPTKIKSVTTDTPFDSPITGTPVVYPAGLGQTAQRVFVGDADGTLWRLDLSDTCTLGSMGSCGWKVMLFADVAGKTTVSGTLTAASVSQPIVVAPVVSQSPAGSLVVNVATGDQESIVPSTETNYVMSIEEQRFTPRKAVLRWFHALTNAERVTGPMAVFDRTLYFASYTPQNATGTDVCGTTAKSYLWGVDYYTPATANTPASGGAARWCKGTMSSTGCNGTIETREDVTTSIMGSSAAIIPGVSVRQSLSCATDANLTDEPGSGIKSMTPSTFEITFNWSAPRTSGGLPSATTATMSRRAPTPRYNATLDAWAFVTD